MKITKGQSLKPNLSRYRGNKFKKEDVLYYVDGDIGKCKMKYIGQTGRQINCRTKKYEAD